MRLKTLGIVLSFCVVTLVVALCIPAVRSNLWSTAAPVVVPPLVKNAMGAHRSGYDFLFHCQNHDWHLAWALLSSRQQKAQTKQSLQKQWQGLEQRYGKIEKWKENDNMTLDVTPRPYTNISYRVYGAAGIGKVSIRVVNEKGRWGVDNLKAEL